jgi:ferritin-like metal-binding protein YciE
MSTHTAPAIPGTETRLEDFFVTMLQELYWSETHLLNVLDSMEQAASAPKLRQAFAKHREETTTHVKRLEEVFQTIEMPALPERSAGLQGIFDEGWQVIDETEPGSAQRDVALIIAAQKVEHYEIACYGSLVTLAKTMGKVDIADTLAQTLAEEKKTDTSLTKIAEANVNTRANKEKIDTA